MSVDFMLSLFCPRVTQEEKVPRERKARRWAGRPIVAS